MCFITTRVSELYDIRDRFVRVYKVFAFGQLVFYLLRKITFEICFEYISVKLINVVWK